MFRSSIRDHAISRKGRTYVKVSRTHPKYSISYGVGMVSGTLSLRDAQLGFVPLNIVRGVHWHHTPVPTLDGEITGRCPDSLGPRCPVPGPQTCDWLWRIHGIRLKGNTGFRIIFTYRGPLYKGTERSFKNSSDCKPLVTLFYFCL